jgi:tRNA(adenine34) deaminase
MQEALDLARSAMDEMQDFPIAALLVVEGKVVARERNKVISGNRLDHAEIRAIQKAISGGQLTKKERESSTLYTTLEPCMMCFGAMMNYNIGNVCYALESLGDGVVYLRKEKGRHQPSYRPPKRIFPVRREESAHLFLEFATRNQAKAWAIQWASDLANQVIVKPNKKATFRIASEGQCTIDLLSELNPEPTSGEPNALFCQVCRTAKQHVIEVTAINDLDSAESLPAEGADGGR